MPGGSTTSQNQQQSSTTAPYAPTQAPINSLINTISGTSTAPTAAQMTGVQQLLDNAGSAPNFAPAATTDTNTLLAGGGGNYSGILNDAYANLTKQLTPFASGANVGKNDALQPELDTIGNDVQNRTQAQFAAAGRSFSPAEAQAIARGTAQGEAPVEAAQYNTDIGNQLGAAGVLNSAAGSTAGGLNTLNQTNLGNTVTGLSAATAIPGILNQNANNLIAAGGAQQALPVSGVGNLESLLLPIAGLGSQSSGNSTGSTTQQTSATSNIIGGLLGAAGLASKFIPSDARIKKDIKHVGILNSGDNLYEFRFKGDPAGKKNVGVLAQEVERKHPEDVSEVGGVKHVNYEGILRRAA